MNLNQELERSILNRILQNIDPDAAAIISENGQGIVAQHGFEEPEHKPKWSVVERSIESGGPISETNLTHSILCMPFKNGKDELQGLMYVELHRPRRLKHRDLAILQELRRRVEKKFTPSNPASLRAQAMRKLVEARRSANSTLSIVTRVLKPERALVLVEIEGQASVLASHGLSEEESLDESEISKKLIDYLWIQKAPLFLSDAQRELDPEEFAELTVHRIKSVAACPMLGDDGVCRGLVYIDSRNVPNRFTDPQLSILARFADSLRNDLQWLVSPDSIQQPEPAKTVQETAVRRGSSVPPFARRATSSESLPAVSHGQHLFEPSAELEQSTEDDVITIEVSVEDRDGLDYEEAPEATQEDEVAAVAPSSELDEVRSTPVDSTIEVTPEKAALLRAMPVEQTLIPEMESEEVPEAALFSSDDSDSGPPSVLNLDPPDLEEPPLFNMESFESAFNTGSWSSPEPADVQTPAPHEIQTIETEPLSADTTLATEESYRQEATKQLLESGDGWFVSDELISGSPEAEESDVELEEIDELEAEAERDDVVEADSPEVGDEPEFVAEAPVERALDVETEPAELELEEDDFSGYPSFEELSEESYEPEAEPEPEPEEEVFQESEDSTDPETEIEEAEPVLEPDAQIEREAEIEAEAEPDIEELGEESDGSEPEAVLPPVEEEPEPISEPEPVQSLSEVEAPSEEIPSIEDDLLEEPEPSMQAQTPIEETIESLIEPESDWVERLASAQEPMNSFLSTGVISTPKTSSISATSAALSVLTPPGATALAPFERKKLGFWQRLFQALWPWAKKQEEGYRDLTLLSIQGNVVLEGVPQKDGRTTVTLRFANPDMAVLLDLGEGGGAYHYNACFQDSERPAVSLLVQREGYQQVKLSNVKIKTHERGYLADISEITLLPKE